MIPLLVPVFAACIVAGVIKKDIHMIVGAGFMLLSGCIIFSAVGISHTIESKE
jgi:hypothetical protein